MAMIRCVVYRNCADPGDGQVMMVENDLETFLKDAGQLLNIKADRAFTESGGYIDDVSLIRNDEKIYISCGEPFFRNDTSKFSVHKIAVLGAGGVGKSCLSMRYVKSAFVEVYDPTIEDAFWHQTTIDGRTCVLDILDTAGQEDLTMLRRQWVEVRDGFLLVFSVTDRSTFNDLTSFHDLIVEVKESAMPKIPVVIVGNKADLAHRRQVSLEEARELATYFKTSYIETSAKNGINVNEAFESLIRIFVKNELLETKVYRKRKKILCILL